MTASDDLSSIGGSPYLRQSCRQLWQACQDRLGWRDIAEAPCASCAVATVCEQRRWKPFEA